MVHHLKASSHDESLILHVFFFLQTGRKLVFRSEPPQTKRKVDMSKQKADKEEEEMAYFFT